MATSRSVLTRVFSLFCRHEWVSRHERGRMWLVCIHCGRTTSGLEVGAETTHQRRRWLTRWRRRSVL